MQLWGLAGLKLTGQASGWRPREELMSELGSESNKEAESLLLLGTSFFFSLRSSTDWVRLNQVMKVICCTKF